MRHFSNNKRFVVFHVDIDSPKTLLKFYGFKRIPVHQNEIDFFYKKAFERALQTFNKCNIQATFFCVGNELKNSPVAQSMLREAFSAGHEIGNHSYSHPSNLYGLNEAEIENEITQCSDVISSITGQKPIGFRAPDLDINDKILNVLEKLNFKYDSSVGWSSINPLITAYHKFFCKADNISTGFGDASFLCPSYPYYPLKGNLRKKGQRKIVELPLTRTSWLQLPFYSNFHLVICKLFEENSRNNFPLFLLFYRVLYLQDSLV